MTTMQHQNSPDTARDFRSQDDTAEITVLFVDLVKYASLTSVHGDQAAADAATTLYEITRNALDENARLVKTLGDGVLLTTSSPANGLRCAATIIEQLHEHATGLDARCGADHGTVINQSGDIFGASVNLAARAATRAAPGTIAAPRVIALSASNLGLTATPLGSQLLKGFLNPIELFQIDPCNHPEQAATDPVCGMRLAFEQAIEPRQLDGRMVGFCSTRCAEIYRQSDSQTTVLPD
jgi:class 3 adenylate cyclase